MHPALSVIFFTTLSGAGYGLLAWTGLGMALSALRGTPAPHPEGLQLAALVLGLLLSTVGLLCSLAHLGKPARAWRAVSQWRTSWLSREGVLALATPLPALVAIVLLLAPAEGAEGPGAVLPTALGLALAALALATVACTAMIYASLRPIPAWRHPLVLPVYLLFAVSTGLALQLALVAALRGDPGVATLLPAVALSGLLLAVLKALYWRAIDRAPAPVTRGAAVGLPGRAVRVFERPHTEASYVTREMAFQLARRHARRLRLATVAALVALPLPAALAAAAGWVPALPAAIVCALALLAGSFVERWLFFAQARHVVASYY